LWRERGGFRNLVRGGGIVECDGPAATADNAVKGEDSIVFRVGDRQGSATGPLTTCPQSTHGMDIPVALQEKTVTFLPT